MKLDEVERLIREQSQTLSDRDLSKYLNNFEKNKSSTHLVNEHSHHHSLCNNVNTNNLQPKSLISSLLFTPTLRRSASSAGANIHEPAHRCGGKSVNWADIPGHTDQQVMFKETISKNFQENLNNLERTKIQPQNIIDNLRTSLSEIEIFTANNIFKLTSMNQ